MKLGVSIAIIAGKRLSAQDWTVLQSFKLRKNLLERNNTSSFPLQTEPLNVQKHCHILMTLLPLLLTLVKNFS